jgi:hypothetical protein
MADNENTNTDKSKLPKESVDVNATDANIPRMDDLDSADSAEDMNATMMGIDIGNIDLDGNTKTEIRIDVPSDDEIIQEQLEQKKSPIERFVSALASKFKSGKRRELPRFLRRYYHIWICPPGTSVREQLAFYFIRMLIVAYSVWFFDLLIGQTKMSVDAGHPASMIYMVVVGSCAVLCLLALLFKASPSWLATLPLTALMVIIACAALLYHTADPDYFFYKNAPLSEWLNWFYITTVIYIALTTVFSIAESIVAKIFFGIICLICIAPLFLNIYSNVDLELAFFGYGFLRKIPYFFVQPQYVVFHLLLPILFFVFVILSFSRHKIPSGFARSLSLLLLVVVATSLGLMQKNRVFHAVNFLVSEKLEVGGVELEIENQSLKIETKNFKNNLGNDTKARYRMSLKSSKIKGQFLLQVVDQFNAPVKNLTKQDISVYADQNKVKDFKFTEDEGVNPERGNYILELKLSAKQPLITWDEKKTSLTDKDKIIFKLSDVSKIRRIVIKEHDDNLLDVEYPKADQIEFPLSYFEEGDHRLLLSVYDHMDQEVVKETIKLNVKVKADFSLLSPVELDVVGDQLPVLLLPKHIPISDIKSVSYLINAKEVYHAEGFLFFHSIEISDYPVGNLSLTVNMVLRQGTLTKTVSVKRVDSIPRLIISRPLMGAFALRNTQVKYSIENDVAKIAAVKVFVNGVVFKDLNINSQSFDLPVSRWAQSELFITIQAVLQNGQRVSDWIQVNKGLGVLDLTFNKPSLKFLNYKKIAIVLDASISSLDNWQGKSKWKSIRKIVTDPKVEKQIKKLHPSIVAYGAGKAHYYKDCEDVEDLVAARQYNLAVFKKKLSNIKPKGVAALYAALENTYEDKPDKIFVFADSTDTCHDNMLTKMKKLSRNQKTQIVIFVLGDILEKEKQLLKKLAESTGGKFYQPDTYEILQKTFLDELTLNYEIYSNNQLIHRSPLENKKFHLLPGKYTLKVPYSTEIKELNFTLENGSEKGLEVSGDRSKIKVKERIKKL